MTATTTADDTVTAFGLEATLTFDEMRPHPSEDGHQARPKYTLEVTDVSASGEPTVQFDFWGSIHEAFTGELDADAGAALSHIARDAQMWYAAGGGDPSNVEITAQSLQSGETADVMDFVASEWGIESPSEAVRAFGGILETAQKFQQINVDEGALGQLVHHFDR